MLSRASSFVGEVEPERPEFHVMPKRGWVRTLFCLQLALSAAAAAEGPLCHR